MRLILGPTSAGKSTLVQQLKSEAAERGEHLDVHYAFTLKGTGEIPTGPDDVVHFNLLRGYTREVDRVAPEISPLLPVLVRAADEVTVLGAPRSVLLERAGQRTHAEPDDEEHSDRVYDSQMWSQALESPHLGQIFEHVALLLDEVGTPATYLCSNVAAHDGFAPISRWQYPRLTGPEAEKLCAGGHTVEDLDLGERSYQADYRAGAKGSKRSATLSRALQMPLAGMRVLDIGCAEGAAALSATRMGAEVTALEPRQRRLDKALRIAGALGAEVDFRHLLLDDFRARPNSFDVVLALNVIHHVPDPFAFLDRAAQLSRSHLVLEYPGLEDPKFKSTVRDLGSADPGLPLIGVSLPAQDQTYVYTPASFERYLIDSLGVFRRHQVIESPINGRWLSVFSGKRRAAPLHSSIAEDLKLRRTLTKQEREIERLRAQVRDMRSSRSWKVTAPLRRLSAKSPTHGG